jgi:hypothetical protein
MAGARLSGFITYQENLLSRTCWRLSLAKTESAPFAEDHGDALPHR